MSAPDTAAGTNVESRAAFGRMEWIAPACILGALVAAYAHTLAFEFVFDDPMLITGNPFIQSAANIPRFFTEHFWSGVEIAQKSYYRPLSLLYLLANWKLWGADPAGWHAISVILHSLNTVLVYLLAVRFLKPRPSVVPGAGLAAVMFALHPIQTEVVSWICCFNDLLATLFVLISFHAYCSTRGIAPWPRAQGRDHFSLWYGVSVAGYAVAVLCKEPAALFPVVLVIAECSRFEDRAAGLAGSRPAPGARDGLMRLVPYFGVAAIYFALRAHALGTATTPQVRIIFWRTEILTIPSVLCGYLGHLVLPAGLSAFYDNQYYQTATLPGVILPFILVLTLAGLLLWATVRSSIAGMLAGWALVFLAPTLHLGVLPRGELMHDRYLYLPLAGMSVLAGLGLSAAADKWAAGTGARGALSVAVGLLAAAYAFASFRQSEFWANNLSLYSRGVAIAPHNGLAANNLGAVLLGRGDWNEAVVQFQNAIHDSPNSLLAHYDLGLAYYEAGRYAEAETSFKRAVALFPSDPESNLFLGMTYYHTERLPEAMEYVRKAIAVKPAGVGYHFALAMMLKQSGDMAGARSEFQAELQRDPNHQPSLDQLRQLDTSPASSTKQ